MDTALWIDQPGLVFRQQARHLFQYRIEELIFGYRLDHFAFAEDHTAALTASESNIGIAGLQRPNLVGPVPSLDCQTNPTTLELINCYDASAFALQPQFTFGNAPRNVLRGPKFAATDLSLMKNVPLGGNVQFQIRAEIFNAFNTVNYTIPNGVTVFGSAAFGRISSALAMRQVQLGGRLIF